MKFELKTTLITLTIVAIIMVIITFFVVFMSGAGTYVVSSDLGPNAGIFSTSTSGAGAASSTASSSIALASSTASSTAFASSTAPSASSSVAQAGGTAPITWTQGNETMSITGATLSGAQLTLSVQVQMGSVSECVPLTIRLIADEQGDLSPPVTSQFTFPDTGTCTGTAGETYAAQPIAFTLANPGTFPVLFTTGGDANLLFEVDQNPDGTLTVQPPPNAG